MSKVIEAVYENGVFRPLEPVQLPEGEHVQVTVPDLPAAWQRRLAALDAFEAACTELTEEQWRLFDEAVQRRP
jgi:predicted DNA-binding antitoxin AbrB/MazE fold protein